MRSLLALLAIGLLGFGLAACGSAGKAAPSTPQTPSDATSSAASTSATAIPPAPAQTKADTDKDNDVAVAAQDDTNNNGVLDFGKAASASERRAITELLKRFYTAAAAENGAAACSMIYSTITEVIAENHGRPPSPAYSRGRNCPEVMTGIFVHFHPQLALELPKLQVARVRLVEHHGLAVLSFGAMPERQISVAREGHAWKIQTLLDSEIP